MKVKKEPGLIHLYYGTGKGKTTAAAGVAIRAAGCGRKVVFAQFMKGNRTGEIVSLSLLPNVRIIRNERDMGFISGMNEEEKEEIKRMHNAVLDRIFQEIKNGAEVIVMDEITYPYAWELIEKEKVEWLVREKPEQVELVLTGRNPDRFFVDYADYITEMRCIRHPFEKGIKAREGIEY